MARGDYLVHVYVEQAKKFNKLEAGSKIDPLVNIEIMGEKQNTTALEDIDNMGVATWNQHLFFDFKNKEVKELEKAKIQIKINDKGIFKDEMVGYYEFDMNWIYLRPDHALMHKWVVMSDPTDEDFSAVTAYFKCSITVIGVGDNNIAIEEDDNPESEDVIQPPEIKPEFYQLHIRFFKPEQIAPMDFELMGAGSTDLYVQLEHRSKKLKTKVLKDLDQANKDNRMFDEEFLVPIQIPLMTSRLTLQIYDEDTFVDEVMGSVLLDVADLISDKNKGGKFFWANIFGAPKEASGGAQKKMMNDNPEMGSSFRGRILVQTVAEKREKCKFIKQECDKDDIAAAKKYQVSNQFQLVAFIQAGISLPYLDTKEQSIEIQIGEHEIKSGHALKSQTNYARWCHFSYKKDHEGSHLFDLPYDSLEDLDQIFIYLKNSSGKRVCYLRLDAKDFNNPNAPLKWHELLPDKSVGKVKESHRAGIIGIKLFIQKIDRENGVLPLNPHDSKSAVGKRWKPYTKNMKRLPVHKVRAYIFQCRDLPAADSDGTSDPSLIIYGDGTVNPDKNVRNRTEIIDDNLNPLFYEALEITVEAQTLDNDEFPPIVMDIEDFDEGTIGKGDYEFLSRAIIYKDELNASGKQPDGIRDAINEPRWYKCYTAKGMPSSGEVLASFCIVESDHNFKAHKLDQVGLEKRVKMENYDVKMNVLGLRNLQSPGLLPIKKAFISMNAKSLVPPKLGQDLRNIKTDPKYPGANPTINTTLSFNVPLPVEQLYCPRLACTVYDAIFSFFSQPIVGNFTIPIGDIMHAIQKERKEESAALREVIDIIKARRNNQAPSTYSSLANSQDVQLINTSASINRNVKYGDKQPLLGSLADPDEGQRTAAREAEKKENAEFHPSAPQLSNRAKAQNLMKSFDEKNIGENPGSPRAAGKSTIGKSAMAQANQVKIKPSAEVKAAIKAEEIEKKERAKRDASDARAKANEEFKLQANASASNVIEPIYQWDTKFQINREIQVPPSSLFIAVGWDRDSVVLNNPHQDGSSQKSGLSKKSRQSNNEIEEEKQDKIANADVASQKTESTNASSKKGSETGEKLVESKHYRRFYNDELENVKDVLPVASPFNTYDLKKGQSRGAKAGFWASMSNNVKTDASGEVDTTKITGKFKAVIDVDTKEEREEYNANKAKMFKELLDEVRALCNMREVVFDFNMDRDLESIEARQRVEQDICEKIGIDDLQITKKLADIQSDVILKKMLLTKKQTIVRAYLLDGRQFASRDFGGDSDPYLVVKVGEYEFNERENYQMDEPNPDFFKHYDFEATFPGCAPLVIQAFDMDDLFGDDLIGETIVDLEDRYFLPEWNALADKPAEAREIYHPSMSISQGVIRMWIEINPAKVSPDLVQPIWDVAPRPPEHLELRVCIWSGKDIKMMDAEDCTDAYVRCFFDSRKDALETDTHFRLQPGKKASWNYRLVWDKEFFFHKKNTFMFTIQTYDRDFFSSNDIVGSNIIDLKQLFEDCSLTKRPVTLNQQYYADQMKEEHKAKGKDKVWKFEKDQPERFWVPMWAMDEDGKPEKTGEILIQVDLLPIEFAEKNKVGNARDTPNHSPELPPPEGRLTLSLNPCTMFQQLVGPSMRRKIYCACCCILLVGLILYMLPTILANQISEWL